MSSSELYELLGGGTPENNLAEDYAGVIDYLNRLAGAVEDGNLRHAWEKAGQLRHALEKFERRLETTTGRGTDDEITAFTGRNLDGQKVATAAVAMAQDYHAGRLLHPAAGIKDEAVKAQLAAEAERKRALRAKLGA